MKNKVISTFAIAMLCTICFTSCEKGNIKAKSGKAIDLGLSVKWADRNIGAKKAEHKGCYFAWGETFTKTKFTTATYTYSGNLDTLNLEEDAAYQNWGEQWRMPTTTEINELIDKCKWQWDEKSFGYKVIGPNGKSIFLPATGSILGETLTTANLYGHYWSSSTSNINSANILHFCMDTIKTPKFVEPQDPIKVGTYEKIYGLTIRPVCE